MFIPLSDWQQRFTICGRMLCTIGLDPVRGGGVARPGSLRHLARCCPNISTWFRRLGNHKHSKNQKHENHDQNDIPTTKLLLGSGYWRSKTPLRGPVAASSYPKLFFLASNWHQRLHLVRCIVLRYGCQPRRPVGVQPRCVAVRVGQRARII